MYHSHKWTSNIIQNLDKTDYNHCAIYDKKGYIYESVKNGMLRRSLKESIDKQETILITNFRVQNIPLDKTHLLIENIKHNYHEKTYAHSQALFLAGMLFKKKMKLNSFLESVYNYVFLLFEFFIKKIFDKKNMNMICSELVYRTYLDIAEKENDSRFCLQIPIECNPIFAFEKNNHQLNHPCDINNLNKIKFNIQNNKQYSEVQKHKNNQNSISIFDTLFFSNNYLNNFEKLTLINNEQKKNIFKKKAPTVSKILKRSELYNFITPGDIFRSFNVHPIKTYKTALANNHPDCDVCSN